MGKDFEGDGDDLVEGYPSTHLERQENRENASQDNR
jgi:hypothetical protein